LLDSVNRVLGVYPPALNAKKLANFGPLTNHEAMFAHFDIIKIDSARVFGQL